MLKIVFFSSQCSQYEFQNIVHLTNHPKSPRWEYHGISGACYISNLSKQRCAVSSEETSSSTPMAANSARCLERISLSGSIKVATNWICSFCRCPAAFRCTPVRQSVAPGMPYLPKTPPVHRAIVRRNDFRSDFNGLLEILDQLSSATNTAH